MLPKRNHIWYGVIQFDLAITSSNWLDLDLVAKHCENHYVAKDDKIIQVLFDCDHENEFISDDIIAL